MPKFVTRSSEKDLGRKFVLSTEDVDRVGDVIRAAGWRLSEFRKNPIALFNHDRSAPVGVWDGVRIDGKRLVGEFVPAAPGTSDIADTVRALVDQGILRATSVGFTPTKYKPRPDGGGYEFTEQELLEVSLVSVPANSEALALAKSMGASDATLRTIFAEPGAVQKGSKSPAASGNGQSPNILAGKGKTMSLSQKIVAKEADLVALRDTLTQLTSADEIGDEAELQINDLTDQIAKAEQQLDMLRKAESALAAKVDASRELREDPQIAIERQAEPARTIGGRQIGFPSPIKQRIKSRDKGDLFFKHLVAHVKSHVQNISVSEFIRREYDDAEDLQMIAKADTLPASTAVDAWAGYLVDAANREFLDLLQPVSIAAGAPIIHTNFDRGNAIKYPVRTPGTLAGGFVGEGTPIPVAAGTFGNVPLAPNKLGVITVFTREQARYATVAFEPILRNAVIQDTAYTIDTLFLDNVAASSGVRPAGLQTYATGNNTAASAGATAANILTDIKGRVGQLVGTNRMGERMVWILNTLRSLGAAAVQNASGAFQFRDEINAGQFGGGQLLVSSSVPSSVAFLIDSAFVVMAWEPQPELDVSESATVHMSTVPLEIVSGTGPTTADPVQSMYQTASIALRMLWPVTWGTRAGAIQAVTSCAW